MRRNSTRLGGKHIDTEVEQSAPQEPKAQKQKQKPQSKFDLAAGAAQSKAAATGMGESFHFHFSTRREGFVWPTTAVSLNIWT